MYSLKGSDDLKVTRKGIAHFGTGDYITPIANGNPIPICNSIIFNNSTNISVSTVNRIQLKANILYKLTGQLGTDTSSSGYFGYIFYNVTAGMAVGTRGLGMPVSSTANAVYNIDASLIISPTVDTIIELRVSGGTNISVINSGSGVMVEELESYTTLVPNILDKQLGINQTWQDVKAVRSSGVTYTNNTNKPISVEVCSGIVSADGWSYFYVNEVKIAGAYCSSIASGNMSLIIPVGATYRLGLSAGLILYHWSELR